MPLLACDLLIHDVADVDRYSCSILVVHPELVTDVLGQCQHDVPDLCVVLQILHGGDAMTDGFHRWLIVLGSYFASILTIGKSKKYHAVLSQLPLHEIWVGIGKLADGVDAIGG